MNSLGEQDKTRVIVVGGGFAGVYTAKHLESLFARRDDVEIVLVNRDNYFVFQPLLAEVVSGNIGILDTVSPLRRLLPRTRIFIRDVDAIDLENRTVTLSPGFQPREHLLRFDHLVLALGSVTDFRGIPGLYEHALPFKNLADAISLRNHLIRVLEEASIETDPMLKRQLLTFVVAGGGFSGVEVAAEMNDFLRRVTRGYRDLNAADIRVVLVHSGKRVLERELGAKLSEYATRILERRGVELRLERRLRTATPDAAILDNGDRLETKTLVSTVPSSPNPLIETLSLATERGRLKVDAHLEVDGCQNVWAVGDCALVPSPDGDGFSPPTAQHAVRQGKTLARNIAARINGGSLKTFDFGGLGKMGSLGHRRAVAELLGGIRLSGFAAWLMWRTVYWWKLPGLDRKLKVGLAWLLDMLIPPEFVQLKIGDSQGISQAHFEPGEVIFRQGDLGDSLFIIMEGEADVLLEIEGTERILTRLKAGDYFGELALLNERTRSATVRCATAMSVLRLRKSEFNTLAANLPALRRDFDPVMEERLKRSVEARDSWSERNQGRP